MGCLRGPQVGFARPGGWIGAGRPSPSRGRGVGPPVGRLTEVVIEVVSWSTGASPVSVAVLVMIAWPDPAGMYSGGSRHVLWMKVEFGVAFLGVFRLDSPEGRWSDEQLEARRGGKKNDPKQDRGSTQPNGHSGRDHNDDEQGGQTGKDGIGYDQA